MTPFRVCEFESHHGVVLSVLCHEHPKMPDSYERLLWLHGAAPQAFLGLDCDPDSSILLAAMWLMSQTIAVSLQPWRQRGYGVYLMAALSTTQQNRVPWLRQS